MCINLFNDLIRRFETCSLACVPKHTLVSAPAPFLPATPESKAAPAPTVIPAFQLAYATQRPQINRHAPLLAEAAIHSIAFCLGEIRQLGALVFEYSNAPFDYCLEQHVFTCWQAHLTGHHIAQEAAILKARALYPAFIQVLPPHSAEEAETPILPLFNGLLRGYHSMYAHLQRLRIPITQFNRLDLQPLFAMAKKLTCLQITGLEHHAFPAQTIVGITETSSALTHLTLENCALSACQIEKSLLQKLHASISRVVITVTPGIHKTLTYNACFDHTPPRVYHYLQPNTARFLKITPRALCVFTWNPGALDQHLLLTDICRGKPKVCTYSIQSTLKSVDFLEACIQFLKNQEYSLSWKAALFQACCNLQDQHNSWHKHRDILGSIFHIMRSFKNPHLNAMMNARSKPGKRQHVIEDISASALAKKD